MSILAGLISLYGLSNPALAWHAKQSCPPESPKEETKPPDDCLHGTPKHIPCAILDKKWCIETIQICPKHKSCLNCPEKTVEPCMVPPCPAPPPPPPPTHVCFSTPSHQSAAPAAQAPSK
jgi:hypothetical protein